MMKATACSHSKLRSAVTRLLMSILGVFTAFGMASSAAAVEYESRTLDAYFVPTDINDSGWVVGSQKGAAVLRAGRLRTLASNGTAHAVNNAGVIVGERTDDSGRRAFRTAPALSDVIEDLGLLPGGSFSVATAINEAGTSVGYANTRLSDDTVVEQAVRFSAGQQTPEALGHFPGAGGTAAYAYGINDNGDIVGAFKKADGKHQPFLFLAGGEMKPLPGFDGVDAKAIAVNKAGRIIGNLTYSDGRARGFVFENGTHTVIESPEPDAGKNTWTSGLNDTGQVVGWYQCPQVTCPFVLDNGTVANLLSAMPEYVYGYASAINKFGEIAITNGYSTLVLSPRRARPVVQYSGLPLQRIPTSATEGFGSALALHGDMAVIGAPREDGGTGAVYVYRYDDVGWTEESRLTAATPKLNGNFGSSVAFDGKTIVVGAAFTAAAYVFQQSSSGWVQKATLSNTSSSSYGYGYGNFGAAVAVKGTRIVVGAPYFKENSPHYTGAIYVFDWSGTQWDSTKLIADELPTTSRLLGTSVQLDGDLILAGAPNNNCNVACGAGTVYLFQRQNNGWIESKLTSAKHGFGQQIVVQNDVLAIVAADSFYPSPVYLYRRGTAAEGTPWVEQDWVVRPSYGPVAVDGDRLVVTDNSTGKVLPRLLKREGRIWVDEFSVTAEGTNISALALQGSTLLVGSSNGAGVVTPFSICAPPCVDSPGADVQITLDTPKTALTREVMTHTLIVKNLHPTATAALVNIESNFTDSNGIALNWINVPDACRVSASHMRVSCGVNGLAASAEVRFELRIAAPAAAGTFTHKAIALHSRPDPVPENNTATATTAILPNGEARIEIRNPTNGATMKLAPHEVLDLELDIVNFGVGLAGNFYTVSVDGKPAQHFTAKQSKISLGELFEGKHSVAVALMTADSVVPVTSKTVTFVVEIIAPSVAIRFPRADDELTCHKDEFVSPDITLRHFIPGEAGRGFVLRVDGIDVGGTNESVAALSTIDLCAWPLDTPHTLQVVLRDADGIKADSGTVTFIPRKAIPKITIRQPDNGGVDYARGGFSLIYEFERGYDSAQLAALLNGSSLADPLPTSAGTNAVFLPADLLRDGANELVIVVTTEGRDVQTSVVRFTTRAAAAPPKSKGGALGIWAAWLLVLLAITRRQKNIFSKRHIRGVE